VVPGVKLPVTAINKRPSLPLSVLSQPGALEKFFGGFRVVFKGKKNLALETRLSEINANLHEIDVQRGRLLDLYLSGGVKHDLYLARSKDFDDAISRLKQEYTEVSSKLQTDTITEDEIIEVDEFCKKNRGEAG
jgi:hypothetical protein